MNFRIEKAGSGWNIFASGPPTIRICRGNRPILHVEGPYARAHAAMLELSENWKLLRIAVRSLKKRRMRLKAIRRAIYIDVDNPWTFLLHPPNHEDDENFSVEPRRN